MVNYFSLLPTKAVTFLLLPIFPQITADQCNIKTITTEITCCKTVYFEVDTSNHIDFSNPCPDASSTANDTCNEDYNTKKATEDFINNKIHVLINPSDDNPYNFVHDLRVNINHEVVYQRSDGAYFLFYGIYTSNTYGWYIHNDDSKTNANPFSPAADKTLYYQHDANRVYQTNTDLCPYETSDSLEWEVEYNSDLGTGSQYYKLNNLGISAKIKCADASDTHTIEFSQPASTVTDCNAYGIDPAIVEDIVNNYETIFESFEVSLPALGDTPFWIGIAWHVLSCLFLIGMGIYPAYKMPASKLDKSKKLSTVNEEEDVENN